MTSHFADSPNLPSRAQNIVLILADDLGFSDIGCYGGEIRTPNLDRLSRAGIRHSQFYNTARCSPSRASLLTGLHPHSTGVGVLTRPDLPDGYPGNLNDECTTVAQRFQEAGWQTWMSGKWHLSANNTEPNSSWPTRCGFDRFFGTLAGCGSYYSPQTLMRGEEPCSDPKDDPNFYYTDAITNEAVSWIDEHSPDNSDPFFLYLAYTAPHWPLHARREDIDGYEGVFDEGWDNLRSRRLQRLIAEGLIEPGTPLSHRDPTQPSWEDATDKTWQTRRMQTYAAQVEAMDRGIGEVIEALKRSGCFENTLVVFLADNGACAEELPIGSQESFAQKDLAIRTGTREGMPIHVGNVPEISPGGENTYSSYGVAWANMSNTPLRRYKRWVHEGGISTPLVASWPEGPINAGSIIHTPFQLVDIVPTLLEACGIRPDESEELELGHQLEGRSMLSAWAGNPQEPVPLYWEHIGNSAVRLGRWKLVRDHPEPWELYDIESDRAETNDLSAKNPELVNDLSGLWQVWAKRVGVIDWDAMVTRYVSLGLSPSDAEE